MSTANMPQHLTHTPSTSGTIKVGHEAQDKEVALQNRCQFWLHNKRRLCANMPLPSSRFCGNHDPSTEACRIPCPIDPSHSISAENLESHIKRCPFKKLAQALEGQPYYSKGINGGSSGNIEDNTVDSAAKRNMILRMPVKDFCDLLGKIKSIHSAISVVLPDSYVVPDTCNRCLEQQWDRKLPYQEKHAMQQASIVGNIEAFGILQRPEEQLAGQFCQEFVENGDFDEDKSQVPVVVEFGAGRGYLTQMLTDCYGIRKAFLVERRSYKLKADRSLRQNTSLILERLRIDIADLNLPKVNLLKGHNYIAIGKHLCGSAIDLTIRCCLSDEYKHSKETHSTNSYFQGLALATCCHHLCQWKHYTNTKFLLSLGIAKEEFHAMTWFTSWAVDADYTSELADMSYHTPSLSNFEGKQANFESGDVIRSMPAPDRAALGIMCKEIIDFGRLLSLRDHGLEAQLVKYVPSNISPENHLLLAKCH